MSCTRVLHSISSRPHPTAIPIDLAKSLSLSRRKPLLLLSPTKAKHGQHGQQDQATDSLPRPGLRSPYSSLFYLHSPVPKAPCARLRSCFRRGGTTSTKKRVVFADAIGLALAAVRLFIPETPSSESTLQMKAALTRLQDQQLLSGVREQQQQQQQQQQQHYKTSLGFPPPMLDFKGFLARLRETGVHLQSCSISEQCLIGNVSVCHIGADKAVTVRVTFDSWRSHHDVPCTFLQKSPFGGSDIDVFAFSLCLPKNLDPKEQLEFCVHASCGPGVTPLVDDNMGENYRLCLDKDGLSSIHGDASRFYPMLSKRLSRSSLSAAVGKQSAGELSYFQRSLLSRVGGEGNTSDWARLYPTIAIR